MKFHVYNPSLELIATYDADDIDAATDAFLDEKSNPADIELDCVAKYQTFVFIPAEGMFQVVEEGEDPTPEEDVYR